jgi:hypothetical protein
MQMAAFSLKNRPISYAKFTDWSTHPFSNLFASNALHDAVWQGRGAFGGGGGGVFNSNRAFF